ncbi:MAG: winged helix-turn-helix domain-containing protein [Chromatiaceae bacterium]|nr:winged helix-turn-helix domain-containing protein [Chromatiaceae bacterium]
MQHATVDGDSAPASLVIAGWTLDEDRHCLVRNAEERRLEPKATRLLGHLARHAGQPLSREELLMAIWPDMVVGDEALTTAINKIRRAFDDDRREQSVIETIPKMGYRLVAPVGQIQTAAAEDGRPAAAPSIMPGPTASMHRSSRVVAVAVIGFLLLSAVLVAWYLQPGNGDDALLPAPPPDGRPVTTVSVQAFEVIGDDQAQQYFARGITADLIAQLSRLSGLQVVAAIAEPNPADGANRYRVWGAVHRDGRMLDIEVRLVESASGRQLWAQRYERPFDDLFDIQQNISTQLAEALSLRLNETEIKRIAHRYTASVDAYDLFLRAQSELLVRSASNNERARDLYLQAIALDPSFARAYGGLALIYAGNYRNQWESERNRERDLDQAQKFAYSAKQIDPTLPEIHWVLGYVKTQQRHHDEAVGHLDEALRLDPRFADALALKGGIMTYTGHPAKTITLLREAMRLNPAAGYLYFMTLGRAYFFLNDPDQALINLREALSRNPVSLEVRVYLAAALQLAGEREDAEWQAEEIRSIDPDFRISRMLETYPLVDGAEITQLSAALVELGF